MIKTNRTSLLKFGKITLLVFFIVLILPAGVIAGYEYFKVVNTPEYNPETMPLNYEIIGLGKNGDHQLFLKDPGIVWKAIHQFPYTAINTRVSIKLL